jgi:hypothetical protein
MVGVDHEGRMIRSKSRPRKEINEVECYYCHEMGHYQYQCKKLKIDLEEFKKNRDS